MLTKNEFKQIETALSCMPEWRVVHNDDGAQTFIPRDHVLRVLRSYVEDENMPVGELTRVEDFLPHPKDISTPSEGMISGCR